MEEALGTFGSVHVNFPDQSPLRRGYAGELGRLVVQLMSITAKFVVKKQGCMIPGKHRTARLRYPQSSDTPLLRNVILGRLMDPVSVLCTRDSFPRAWR